MFLANTNGDSWTRAGSKATLLALLLANHLPHRTLALPNPDEGNLQKAVDGLATALGIGPGGSPLPPVSLTLPLTASATTTLPTSSRVPQASITTTTASISPTGGLPVGTNGTTLTNGTSTTTQTRAAFAHFIVGNTFNYTVDTWSKDITLAASKGFDAFALNVGADAWESSQIANAYSAAAKYNSNATNKAAPFKLFFSFDMGSLPCSSASHATTLQSYIRTYANNTSTYQYNGRMLVSTFAGEACTFGKPSLNEAWVSAVKPPSSTNTSKNATLPAVWFVPSFFVDPKTFPNLTVIDGAFHWNSAWPMGNYNISFAPDQSYISNLQNKTYMGAVSPWFFTHYGKDTFNKNWIYRGDDWLLSQRWEMLIQNRTSVQLAQLISWNDFGESHYVGPVLGMQPMSEAWVNGFDHQGWLDLIKYYVAAYKTGTYPSITKDRVYLWARLYPANATAPDPVGRPANYQWTQDYLWAVTQLTAPANVTLSCGTSSQRTVVPAGVSKLKLPLSTNCAVKAVVVRGSNTTVNMAPAGFNYSTRPTAYNFNAFVAASPA